MLAPSKIARGAVIVVCLLTAAASAVYRMDAGAKYGAAALTNPPLAHPTCATVRPGAGLRISAHGLKQGTRNWTLPFLTAVSDVHSLKCTGFVQLNSLLPPFTIVPSDLRGRSPPLA